MINKKYIPRFPHCKIKWLEKILRKLHLFFFKKYYDVCIKGIGPQDKSIYIWNGGIKLSANDIVSSQSFTQIPDGSKWVPIPKADVNHDAREITHDEILQITNSDNCDLSSFPDDFAFKVGEIMRSD